MKTVNHWIGGKTVEGASGNYGPVTDPATGEVTTQVALASAAEVDAAVQVAKEAFQTWGQSSLAARTKVLFAYRALLDANRDAIAELITAEHGKVHSDALGEVARGTGDRRAGLWDHHAAQGRALHVRVEPRGRLLDPPAARRGRGHHPVQLPGDGPDVDVPAGRGLRKHLHPQAEREGPLRLQQAGRADERGRSARRRAERGAR
ncbi:hypothetical protein GCM10020254_54390 [Streptomyces goshikiensis]